jgi:hypothetical protein
VDIDEIDGAAQAVHSSAKLTAIPFDILYGHHFHTGLVDQFCLLAKPIQTKSCGNGDGHPAN